MSRGAWAEEIRQPKEQRRGENVPGVGRRSRDTRRVHGERRVKRSSSETQLTMNEPSTSQAQQPAPPQPPLSTSAGGPQHERPRYPPYPLLSELPIQPCERMPLNNPVDRLILSRSTPQENPDEPIDKDLRPIITESNDRTVWSLDQSRHQKAVQIELKALLEHEKKILLQVQDRALKFSIMREENKKKIDEWEADHKQRMSFYTQFLTQLMEVPEDECLTQEGVPVTVAQKILYKIVEKTANIANNAVVQLSMQITVVNDIDLSLGKLRQFCAVTLKQIDSWLRCLNTQIEQQDKIIELWEGVRQNIKTLKEVKGNASGKRVPAGQLQTLETRVLRLENVISSVHQGSENVAPTQSGTQPQQPSFSATNPCCPQPTPPPPPPSPRSPCPDRREDGHQSHQDNGGRGGGRLPTNRQAPPPPPPPPSPKHPQPSSPPIPCSNDGRGQQRPQYNAGEGGSSPPHPPPQSAPPYGRPPYCPPCPPCPPYYPYPFCPPCPPQEYPIFPGHVEEIESNEEHDDDSLEGGEQVACGLDPNMIPKIQGDLQHLSRKNKRLEELINNFRQMRAILSKEMAKTVNLNQKLQKDLQNVARDANKNAQ